MDQDPTPPPKKGKKFAPKQPPSRKSPVPAQVPAGQVKVEKKASKEGSSTAAKTEDPLGPPSKKPKTEYPDPIGEVGAEAKVGQSSKAGEDQKDEPQRIWFQIAAAYGTSAPKGEESGGSSGTSVSGSAPKGKESGGSSGTSVSGSAPEGKESGGSSSAPPTPTTNTGELLQYKSGAVVLKIGGTPYNVDHDLLGEFAELVMKKVKGELEKKVKKEPGVDTDK